MMETNHLQPIIDFFMDLYRLQLGAPKNAESVILPVEGSDPSSDPVFELRVKRDDQWMSRRMSAGPLGESSGSKSVCYKVAYDELLVVKIPPSPIRDFKKYLDCIRMESRIAVKLAPDVPYVAPGISALLKKIHRFKDEAALDPLELENRYIIWVEDNTQYLKYLKIGETFAFFMDLSRNVFFSNAIEEMHEKDGFTRKVQDEIRSFGHMIDSPAPPHDSPAVIEKIRKIWPVYEKNMIRLTAHEKCDLSPARIMDFFLDGLADMPQAKDKDLPPRFAALIEDIGNRILAAQRQSVENFRSWASARVRERLITRNKPRIKGIVGHLLLLLARLHEKQLAIRDLKPDNIFIQSDPDRYPLYLSEPSEFRFGLIDFETAVQLYADKRDPEQPLPAGTPAYATVSHFFPNSLLKKQFSSLSRILHLQDRHAMIGIIYLVITGECLFNNTRKTLRKVLDMRREFLKRNIPVSEVFSYGSRRFWSSAAVEFKARTRAHRQILSDIVIPISDEVKKMIGGGIVANICDMGETIRKRVIAQRFFDSYEKRMQLIKASPNEIGRLCATLENGEKEPSQEKKQAILFLKNLEHIKTQSEAQEKIVKALETPDLELDVFQLLEIMFNTVLMGMYRPEWGKLTLRTVVSVEEDGDGDDKGKTTEESRATETVMEKNTEEEPSRDPTDEKTLVSDDLFPDEEGEKTVVNDPHEEETVVTDN